MSSWLIIGAVGRLTRGAINFISLMCSIDSFLRYARLGRTISVVGGAGQRFLASPLMEATYSQIVVMLLMVRWSHSQSDSQILLRCC